MSEGNIYPNIWYEGGEALDCFRVNREESMRQRPTEWSVAGLPAGYSAEAATAVPSTSAPMSRAHAFTSPAA